MIMNSKCIAATMEVVKACVCVCVPCVLVSCDLRGDSGIGAAARAFCECCGAVLRERALDP